MPKQCITLQCPDGAEERLVDALLDALPKETFDSLAARGYGPETATATNVERVMGRTGSVHVQLLIDDSFVQELLDLLRVRLSGSQVRFWITPVLHEGGF